MELHFKSLYNFFPYALLSSPFNTSISSIDSHPFPSWVRGCVKSTLASSNGSVSSNWEASDWLSRWFSCLLESSVSSQRVVWSWLLWTFSLVAKMTSVHLHTSLTATHHWPLHQLNVKNAFLQCILDEDVHVEQPLGFVAQGSLGSFVGWWSHYMDWSSSKSLLWETSYSYSRAWSLLCSEGSVCLLLSTSKKLIQLVVYVDGIIITNCETKGISNPKSCLQRRFQTKGQG